MQRIYVFVFCSVLGLLPAVHVLPAYAQQSPRVVVSEINWGGSDRGIADEWFELANRDAQPADISGWSVTGMATGGAAITLAEGTVIPGYGTYLVANYAVGDDSTLAVAPDFVTTAVSIPNTKLTAALVMPDGTVVDELLDPGTPDFGSSVAPYTSMERDLATLGWRSASVSTGLVDPEQLGTPGFAEVPLVIEVVEEILIDNVTTPTETAIEDPTVINEPFVENTDDAGAVTEMIDPLIEEPIIADPEFTLDVVREDAPVVEEAIADIVVAQVVADVVEPTAEDQIVAEPEFTDNPILEPVVEEIPEETSAEVPSTEASVDVITEETSDVTIVETLAATEYESAASAPPTETATTVVDPTTASSEGESGDLAAAVVTPSDDDNVQAALDPIVEAITAATSGAIRLNEIFVDGDEWIEVLNADAHDIDVSAWVVHDASGKETSLGTYVLAPGALLVIDAPSGKLNNSGDTVTLVDGTGTVIDHVAYGTDEIPVPENDESLVRIGDGWFVLATITKNATNPVIAPVVSAAANIAASETPTKTSVTTATPIYVAPSNTAAPTVVASTDAPAVSTTATVASPTTKAAASTKTTSTAAKTSTKKKVTTASGAKKASKKTATQVTNIQGAEDGAPVRYTGTVIALPGTFGSQVMLLDGAAVYFYHADWPTLTLGDMVTVEGEVSTARGERRIKVASAAAIVVTGHVDIAVTDVQAIDAASNAQLVRIDGIVRTREGDVLTVILGDSTVRVIASAQSGIRWSTLAGNHVTIVGVVRHLDGEYILMPRSMDDITVQHEETIAPARSAPHFPTRTVVGGGVLTSTAGMLGYWFVRSRALIPSL